MEKSVGDRLIRWSEGESPRNPEGSLEGSLGRWEVAVESREPILEERMRIGTKGYRRPHKYP
jgi:hypothetical protein